MTTDTFNWKTICASQDLSPFVGVRALVEGEQVALFFVNGKYYAISAIDPFTKTAILARGIVGDIDGALVVASPLYKQHFSLDTGACIEDDSVQVKTYPVREKDGLLELAVA